MVYVVLCSASIASQYINDTRLTFAKQKKTTFSDRSQALTMFCSKWFGIYFTSSLFGSFALAKNCYYPDGFLESNPEYRPCGSISGVDSMCCATGRHNAYSDTCLSNGLCHNRCDAGMDCNSIPG